MGKKKLKDPVVLFASIERKQHSALRRLAYKKHRSIADLTRAAIRKLVDEERKLEKAQR